MAVLGGLLFVVVGVIGGPAPGSFNASNAFDDPGSQATRAREQIERATGEAASAGVIALVRAPRSSAEVARVARTLRADPGIARVALPPPSGRSAAVSRDGRQVLVAATLRARASDSDVVKRLQHAFAGDKAVVLGGSAVAGQQTGSLATSSLAIAELIAFPLLVLLSLVFFRGVAALLPVAIGGFSVLGAFAVLRAINSALPLSPFALNLVIGLGLGLAIDYSLFCVSRFREELGRGADVPSAVRGTMQTAGRTVLFSAITVAAAMGVPDRVPAAVPGLDGARWAGGRTGRGRLNIGLLAGAAHADGTTARKGDAGSRGKRVLVSPRPSRDATPRHDCSADRGRAPAPRRARAWHSLERDRRLRAADRPERTHSLGRRSRGTSPARTPPP